MKLNMELEKRGNELIICKDVPLAWVNCFVMNTRAVKLEKLKHQHRSIDACVAIGAIVIGIMLLAGVFPNRTFGENFMLAFLYWSCITIINRIVYVIRIMPMINPNSTSRVEICFIKGTARNLPDNCYFLKGVSQEIIPELLAPDDIEEMQDREEFYAVCRCFSIMTATKVTLEKTGDKNEGIA